MTQVEVPLRRRVDPRAPSSPHPATAAVAVGVAAFAVLVVAMLGLGLLLTEVLAETAVGRWDGTVDRWFAAQRTPTWNDVTAYGSAAANTETVVGIGLLVVIVTAVRRRWRPAVLLGVGLGVEVTVFLATTFLVDRPRPDVERLDAVPPTSSFPSGHTAAAVVLYLGLALLCSWACRNALLCAVAWVVGALAPVAVGLARMYRGMHHPTDVVAGTLLGLACLAVAVLAVHTVATVVERRHAGEQEVRS